MRKVGIRELRQNLSVYVDQVKAGETLEVTEHNHPVALLTPLPSENGLLGRLIAEGKVTPATRSIRELPWPPRAWSDPAMTSERLLNELREDRI